MQLPDSIVDAGAKVARHGASIRQFIDAEAAVRGADGGLHGRLDVDGPGSRDRARKAVFAPYQVNDALMARAGPRRAVHALPAGAPRRRG